MAGSLKMRAAISASTDGNNELVAAVSGAQIVVTHIVLITAGVTTVLFKSGTAGANLTGAMSLGANGGWRDKNNDDGLFATAKGESLNMVLTEAVQVSGYINYRLCS